MYLQSNYLHWWAYVQLIWNVGNSEVITTSGAWYSFSISKLFLEMSYISHGFFANIKKLYWWHFLLTKSKHWFIIKYLIDQGTLQTPFCCVFHCTTDLITGGFAMTGGKKARSLINHHGLHLIHKICVKSVVVRNAAERIVGSYLLHCDILLIGGVCSIPCCSDFKFNLKWEIGNSQQSLQTGVKSFLWSDTSTIVWLISFISVIIIFLISILNLWFCLNFASLNGSILFDTLTRERVFRICI